MNKPNFMEEEIKYIHRHAKWFFDRIEDITNLHLSLADKSELLNYLGKSYHANQIDAIYFDAYVHLQEMGHQSEILENTIEERKRKAFELADFYIMMGHSKKEFLSQFNSSSIS